MMTRKAFLAAAAAAGLLAFPAQAHTKLQSASPAPNATVGSTARIELHFTAALAAPSSGIDLAMTEMPGMKMNVPMRMTGLNVTVGPDGKTLVIVLRRPLAAGRYKLDYHVVSADTHRVQGSYAFRIR